MRHTTIVTAALVVLAMAIAPLGAAGSITGEPAATTSSTPAVADNETQTNGTNVSAGAQLSAVAGVEEAELESGLAQRSFGIQIARAASDDAKAGVINRTVGDLQERLTALQAEKERLREARNNGSISQSQYAARMAELSAHTESVRQLANETESASSGLPADVLRANGVNVAAIQSLQQNAANMTGPEVAALARTIAGPQPGNVSAGPSGQPGSASAGADGDAGTAARDVERADAAVQRATERVERADARVTAGSDASDALQTAKSELEEAEETLQAAQTALENGNDADARELAAEALDQAEAAQESAREALEHLSDDGAAGSAPDGDGESGGDNGSTTAA